MQVKTGSTILCDQSEQAMPTGVEKHSNKMPAALSSHFMRNWARSTVIWCSLHWHHHCQVGAHSVSVCQMCVNGGVWEAVVQSDLTPLTPAHPDKWESMLGAHRIQLNKMAVSLLQQKASLSLTVCNEFYWKSIMWCLARCRPLWLYVVCLWWAHLSLSRARGWLVGSLSPAEMWGDQGLKAEGLCLGWMQLSPWKQTARILE